MAKLSYNDELNRNNMAKTKEIISALPPFVADYFTSRKSNTTTKTRLSYAYDIRTFFLWLKDNIRDFEDIKNITPLLLSKINARDIEEYIDFLQTDAQKANKEKSIARKLACLNSFFTYMVRNDLLDSNPCAKVLKPKIHKDNRIIKMTPDEVSRFLDAIEYGCDSMTKRQRIYLANTKERDLAIATLLLGTGIRVSECVGLNISDIDFENCRISILRKGQKRQYIGMGDEVIDAIKTYLPVRELIVPANPLDQDALFLSTRKTRICVQAIENLIVKYANAIGTKEHITPHKLRKTYGTELYNETGDIYLVARALGHESVNTTKNHYISDDENSLIQARNKVKLRN